MRPSLTPFPSPTPEPAPSATATGTVAPRTDPPAQGRAPYCAVADRVTPVADYDRHAETPLDWTYRLPDGYVPPDLVSAISGREVITPFRVLELPTAADLLLRRGDPAYGQLLADDESATVRSIVYADLSALRAAATAAGVRLVILSAYRSYARQQATFAYWVSVSSYDQALEASARPGHSEHQLGTAIDFGDGIAAPWEYADWAATASGAWLREHAGEFGFVMSYPLGSSDVTCYKYEPWHYRWVGRGLASAIATSGMPLRAFQAGPR